MDTIKKEFDPLNVWSTDNASKIETITPHKVIVVFLVQEYLKVRTDEFEKCGTYSAKYRRQFSMLLLKLIQYPDMSYKDLHGCLQISYGGIDPRHLRYFAELMENISTIGVDILFDLQIFIGHLLTEDKDVNNIVNQFGIVGFYIRRVLLALNKMSFPDIIDLYKSILAYYERGARAVAMTSPNRGGTITIAKNTIINESHALVMEDVSKMQITAESQSDAEPDTVPRDLTPPLPAPGIVGKEKNGHSKWSVKQADLFIAQQCNLLENNEVRAMKPNELQQRLKEIVQDIPFYTQAHILNYLNSLRIRDFFNALDAFHCAYDRTATRANTAAGLMTDSCQMAATNLNNKGLQYSSLNLAILHVQFGHQQEALASLRECVMLAQEAGDRTCLQLAQSWLCLLDQKYVLLCENTVASQMENSAVQAVSLGVQFIVNVAAVSGVPPSKVFELLMKSEVINFQNSLMDLVTNCISQKAAVWQQYGKTELSSLCNQLLLQVNRTANKETESTDNNEGVCLALCSVALWLSLQGDIILSAVVLQHASERFTRDPLSRHWQLTEAYILSQQAIEHGKWTNAARACSQLYLHNQTLGILQRASLNIARRHCVTAQRQLQALLRNEELEPLNRVRAQILIVNTFLDQGGINNDGSGEFSAELMSILTEASVYAKEKYLSYEAAVLDVHTAYVLLLLGLPQQALKNIRNCMETIFANGGIYDCARTQFVFVRCLVAAQHTLAYKVAKIAETLPILQECIKKFLKLEVYAKAKDIYIYLATFYDNAKMLSERNKWAYKFRDLEEQFPTPVEYLNVLF